MTTSILIADDHAMVREGFSALLTENPLWEVVATVSNGREAVKLACQKKPDIVLMDIGMPELNGIDACKKIHTELPITKVIALSMYSSNHMVIEMFRAGAAGYILKYVSFSEVTTAIETVMQGNLYLSPSITSVVVNEVLNNETKIKQTVFTSLSSREREVTQLFAEGKTTKEIAFLLGISGRTVDAHRKNVMQKLNLNTIADLTRYALAEGIVNPLEYEYS